MSTLLLASQQAETFAQLQSRRQAVQQMVTPMWVNYGDGLMGGTSAIGAGVIFNADDIMACTEKPKQGEVEICLATKRLFS